MSRLFSDPVLQVKMSGIIFFTLIVLLTPGFVIGESDKYCMTSVANVRLSRRWDGIGLILSPNTQIDARQGDAYLVFNPSGGGFRRKRSNNGCGNNQNLFALAVVTLAGIYQRLTIPLRNVQIGQQHHLQINERGNPVTNVIRRRIGTRTTGAPVFRTESLVAEIRHRHINQGRTSFTDNYHRDYLNGTPEDQRGHILGSQFGGRATGAGDLYYNLTPQHETINQDQPNVRGRHLLLSWVEMERQLAHHLAADVGNWAQYMVILNYPNNQTGRPSGFEFTVTLRGRNDEVVDQIVGTLRNSRVSCLFGPPM